MSETLHKLQVVIEGNTSKLNQAAREAMATTRRLTDSLNAEMRRINSPVENLRKSMNDGRNDFGLGRLRQVMRKIRNYGKEAQVAAGIKVYTDDYKELLQKYTDIEKKQDDLLKKMKAMSSSESFVPTKEFEDLEKNIQKSSDALEKLNWQRVKMERSGKDMVPTQKFTGLEKSIQKTSQMLKNLDDQRVKMEQSGKNKIPTEEYKFTLDEMNRSIGHLKSLSDQLNKLDNSEKVKKDADILSDRSQANIKARRKLLNADIQETEKDIEWAKTRLKELEENHGAFKESDSYGEVVEKISRMNKELQEYEALKNAMLSDGSYQRETDSYREVTGEISRMNKKLQEYLDLRSALIQDSSALEKSDALIKNEQAFERMNEELQRYEAELGEIEKSGKDIKISDKWKNVSTGILSKTFSGMKSTLGQVTAGIKTAGGAFASLIQKFATGIPMIGRARNFMNGLGNTGRGLSGILGTLGMTAKFMAASFIIQGSVNGAKQGLENLAQYSDRTNASMSTLKTSLVQLQNGLATAFEPILTAVTPILDTLINYLISATNAIAQFFAALTGQSTYTKATRAQQDYAAGLNKTSSAANGANNSVKALQRTVLGFDEINKLEDKSSSGGSGGSGGAGVGGMFDTETVANSYADFAEKIKDAWAKADFTELGGIFGTKIKDALDGIPWDDIQETARKVGTSLATFINGAVEVSGLADTVGKTVAELLNTGVAGANSFMKDLHWDSVGQFVADSMNSFVQKANWKGIGTAVKNGVNGVIELSSTWADAFDFKEVGKAVKTAVKEALTGIKWTKASVGAGKIGSGIADALNEVMTPDTFSLIGETAAGALNTVVSGAHKFIGTIDFKGWGKSIAAGVNKFFKDFDWVEAGLTFSNAVDGILDTLLNALSGTDWEAVGKDIGDFVAQIDYRSHMKKVGEIIWAAIKGAFTAALEVAKKNPNLIVDLAGLLVFKITATKIFDVAMGTVVSKLAGAAAGLNTITLNPLTVAVAGAIGLAILNVKANQITGGPEALLKPIKDLFKEAADKLDEFSKSDKVQSFVKKAQETLKEVYGLMGIKLPDGSGTPGINGAETPEIEVSISAKDDTEAGISSAKVNFGTLPGSKETEVEANDKTTPGLESAKTNLSQLPETKEIEIGADTSSAETEINNFVTTSEAKKVGLSADLKVDKVEIPEDKKKVADLTGIITNKTIQWKNPIDNKVPGLEGQVSKVTPALGWDSSLDGVRAEILSMSPAKGWNDTLANVTAQAKKIVFAKNVNNGLDGVKAVFTSKKISFDKTVGSMTAQFEKKTVKNFNRTIGNMNAQFEKKSTKDFNRTIGNMTAQFDKGKDNIKDKTYGGFWARMDRASDNVSNGDKYLSGVTAEVNKLTKAAGTVLELAGTIVTGGGGVKIKLASGGLYKNGQWQPVTAAASGGAFSTGQMFIAREAGPELVGRIGRSTAVMNNNQIVSSVASGVYSAVSAAMSQFSSRGSGSDTPVFNIYVGGKKITDVVIEEVNRRTSATGSCPILT